VHAHLGAAYHEGVAHVVAGVSGVNQLNLVERLVTALLDGHEIREDLGGVVLVGQAVPYRNARVAGEVLDEPLREASILDTMVHAAQNFRRILDRLLLPHLAVGEKGDIAALVPAGGLEGAPRARRGLIENENNVLALEEIASYARAFFRLEIMGKIEEIAYLFGREILKGEETASSQVRRHDILRANKLLTKAKAPLSSTC
jgi:hypothetical protein